MNSTSFFFSWARPVSYPGIQILSLGGVSLFFCPFFFFSTTREHSELYIFFFAEQKKTKKMAPQAKNFLGTV